MRTFPSFVFIVLMLTIGTALPAQTEQTITIQGLSAPAKVMRDKGLSIIFMPLISMTFFPTTDTAQQKTSYFSLGYDNVSQPVPWLNYQDI